MCLFWNGEAARPGLEKRLALLRDPHPSLSKWDPWVKALLGDESREWAVGGGIAMQWAVSLLWGQRGFQILFLQHTSFVTLEGND